MPTAIEEQQIIKSGNADAQRGCSCVAENVIDRRLGVLREGNKAIRGARHRNSDTLERLDRHLLSADRIASREDQAESCTAEVSDHELVWPLRRRLPRNVP